MLAIKQTKQNIWFLLCSAIILTLGIYLRARGLSTRGLEYDEFWSYTHYAKKSIWQIFHRFESAK